ncbi:hypothetical protein QTN47_20810 [Danxiaibacter flavus]|uniref:DUF4380 domain-containing protein n=1 Tax=Danxiaibacter flavus TaxID=3049108 RepID=A0ABV3ZJD4_9BACT|nr:hypothetical protein QNM32_20815 [Chitinophagaceae bacterium DXS]
MYEKISYGGWPNCIRLYNDRVELIVTTDVGPRIVKFGFINGQDFLYLVPSHRGTAGGDEWRIYGGHRLWLAPEAIPFSYSPDNDMVQYFACDNNVTLIQHRESVTGIVKEMDLTLSRDSAELTVVHRVTNQNERDVQLSVWPITMLSPGGTAILPQEPFGEGDAYLLPARSLALWHYTKMNDPRWTWGEKYICAKQDALYTSEQKIGVTNRQGWMAYCLNNEVLIKKISFDPSAVYPDYNCNNEIYINGNYLEIETLGPLSTLAPGETIEHTEHWLLAEATLPGTEQSIDDILLPLVRSFVIQ